MAGLKNEKGFTLLEIIISIAVLAVVSVFVLQMFAVSVNTGRRASDLDMAVLECQTAVENLKTFGDFRGERYDMALVRADFGEGVVLLARYDEDWQMTDREEDGVFTLTVSAKLNGGAPADITAEIVRGKPYLLESESGGVVFSLKAAYLPA